MKKLCEYITHLVDYAEKASLLAACDRTYAINGLLAVFGADEYEAPASLPATPALEEILAVLCDIAYEKGLIAENGVAYRDLFDTRLMGVLTPAPSVVRAMFAALAEDEYYMANCRVIMENREWTTERLRELGFSVLPSCANFVFATHPHLSGKALYLSLKERRVLVRHFDKERIREYNRITIGTREQMACLIQNIEEILKESV